MQEVTKAELEKGAARVFKNNPGIKKVYATTDGNFFLDSHKSLADDHARKNGCKVVPLDRPNENKERKAASDQKPEDTKPKAADVVAAIEKAETVEAVDALAKDDDRKTVIEAATKRKQELETVTPTE